MDGKWKLIEGFKNVVEFNCENLDIQTQLVQEKKMDFAFMYLLASIKKHFDPWANMHLPFALFSDSPTAQVVALFLLDVKFTPPVESYNSPSQGERINVRKFQQFLEQWCITKDDIINTNEIKQHHQEIRLIQQGVNIWAEKKLPPLLLTYRLHYILHLGSFSTTTHMAERGVKLDNHCSL